MIAWHGAGFYHPAPTIACFAASVGVSELLMIDLMRPALEARDQLAAGLEPLDTLLLDHDTLLMPSAFLTADGLTSTCSFSLHATTVIPWMMAPNFLSILSADVVGHHLSTHGRSTTSNVQVDRCWRCRCR